MNRKNMLVFSILWLLFLSACNCSKMALNEKVNSLRITFPKDQIDDVFVSYYERMPSKLIEKSTVPYIIPKSTKKFELTDDLSNWLKKTQATSLIIIKDGKIRYENYFRKHSKEKKHISFSVSKSFISLLVGICIEKGFIRSIDEMITSYIPELENSGYKYARIKDVLQMSSGVKYEENYKNNNSEVHKMTYAVNNGSVNEFICTLKSEEKPGILHSYRSCDTQALAMLLTKATGKSITELTQEYIWQDLGMEGNAYWLTDKSKNELAFCGLNAQSIDLAKFGLLYLNEGINFQGKQIISKEWVKQSYTPDEKHIMPNASPRINDSSPWGYGYQFWLVPDGVNMINDFMAIGVYGQYVYINRKKHLVIVKTSAFHNYLNESDYSEKKDVENFRRIANNL